MEQQGSSLDIQHILDILPHRYPLLLVDRIIAREPGQRITAIKNVTFNEEAMAQAGAILLLGDMPDRHRKLVYFAGIDGAKFRRPVVPGDQLRFEVEVLKLRSRSARLRGEAYVGDALAAEAEMFSTMVDRATTDGAQGSGTP
jgi:3-hydroxymyristoyl/3-hydroxydecanoyl-(acyl carrier protein) dehydratase